MTVAFPVEELGRAADVHPAWCRLRHDDGIHRSRTLDLAGLQVWATADASWRVEVHEAGTGALDGGYLKQIYAYLQDPAARRS